MAIEKEGNSMMEDIEHQRVEWAIQLALRWLLGRSIFGDQGVKLLEESMKNAGMTPEEQDSLEWILENIADGKLILEWRKKETAC
jgi:hypothetical protein